MTDIPFDTESILFIHMTPDIKNQLTKYTQVIYNYADVLVENITNLFNSPIGQTKIIGRPTPNDKVYELYHTQVDAHCFPVTTNDVQPMIITKDYRFHTLQSNLKYYSHQPRLLDNLVNQITLYILNVTDDNVLTIDQNERQYIINQVFGIQTEAEEQQMNPSSFGHDTIREQYNAELRKFIPRNAIDVQQLHQYAKTHTIDE